MNNLFPDLYYVLNALLLLPPGDVINLVGKPTLPKLFYGVNAGFAMSFSLPELIKLEDVHKFEFVGLVIFTVFLKFGVDFVCLNCLFGDDKSSIYL